MAVLHMLWTALCLVHYSALAGKFTVTDEVYIDVEVPDMFGPFLPYKGRFVIAVFGDTVPVTSWNIVSIARGFRRGEEVFTYRGSYVHRIVPDFLVQMGDITVGDGSGGKSIFGRYFPDEDFILSHRSPGWVAMANHGPDTNNSQFYITLKKARWLDGKNVVFGKVIRGYDVIETLADVVHDPATGVPLADIRITGCGVFQLEHKYDLPEEVLDRLLDWEHDEESHQEL